MADSIATPWHSKNRFCCRVLLAYSSYSAHFRLDRAVSAELLRLSILFATPARLRLLAESSDRDTTLLA